MLKGQFFFKTATRRPRGRLVEMQILCSGLSHALIKRRAGGVATVADPGKNVESGTPRKNPGLMVSPLPELGASWS